MHSALPVSRVILCSSVVLCCLCMYNTIVNCNAVLYFSVTYVTAFEKRRLTHTHNSKTHYSPSNDSCIHRLTIQASIDAESCLGCFCWGLFLRLVRCPWVLALSSNGSISLGKQTAGCNSPHDWLMNSQLVLHDTQVSCFSYSPVNNQNQSNPSYTGFMPILLIL